MRYELEGVTPTAVGNRLRLTCEARNYKQKELADLAGLSKEQVSNYFAGRDFPQYPNVVKLSKALRVSLDWVIAGDIEALNAQLERDVKARIQAWENGGGPKVKNAKSALGPHKRVIRAA